MIDSISMARRMRRGPHRSDDLTVSSAPSAGYLVNSCVPALGVDQGGDGRIARSFSRQRLRLGPMLPTGIPSLALISTYGTGGSG